MVPLNDKLYLETNDVAMYTSDFFCFISLTKGRFTGSRGGKESSNGMKVEGHFISYIFFQCYSHKLSF